MSVSGGASARAADQPPSSSLESTTGATLSAYIHNNLMADTIRPVAAPKDPPSHLSFTADIYGSSAQGQLVEAQLLKTEPSKISFTTPAQDAVSGNQPDYYLNAEGKLVKNPKATPSKDGSISIEVEGNNSAKQAKQYGDQLQKQAIGNLVAMFKAANPGAKVPEMWQAILDAQPDTNYPNTGDGQNNNTVNSSEEQAYESGQSSAPSSSGDTATTAPSDGTSQQQPQTPESVTGGSSSSGGGSSDSGGGTGGGGTSDSGDGGTSGGAGGGPSSGSFVSGPPSDLTSSTQAPNEQAVMNYFVEKGLTPAQAAGIVGNLDQESGVNPARPQDNGGPGYGLAQWGGSRLTALEQFAQSEGKPYSDLGVQLDFMWKELNTTEAGSLAALKQTTTATQAADVFEQDYERAGTPDNANRETQANRVLATYEASHPTAVASH